MYIEAADMQVPGKGLDCAADVCQDVHVEVQTLMEECTVD